ncbi:MAG: T9SS type A sorting domain-containing protein [Ginsengibacter sp.]
MKKLYLLAFMSFIFSNLSAQAPGCTTNVSPVNQSTNVNPNPYVTFKWNPVPGATSYDIYVSTKIPPKQLIGSSITDSFHFYNAEYGTIYNWYVVPKNADGLAMGCTSSATSFMTTPTPPPPANDNCVGAIDLSNGVINGTTLGATQTLPAITCGGYKGTADDDVWYQFTALSSGSVLITLDCGDNFDGVLQAYRGPCNALVNLVCSDTSQEGGREQITLNAVAGTSYKIRIYSYGAQLSDKGNFTISASGSALPITLLSFRGEHSGNKNILNWSTANELNNSGFEVQYSFSGTDFRKLSFVNSKAINGNSNSVLNYQYIQDKAPGGNVYYRLMQKDKDGQTSYSNVILIKGDKINFLSLDMLYPNPAKNKLNLIISSPENNNISIIITDLAGKKVYQQPFSIVNGGNNLDLDISKLPAGTYFLKAGCSDGCKTSVSKFVKE